MQAFCSKMKITKARIWILYMLWAILLPNHSGAGQNIFKVFARPGKGIEEIAMYGTLALVVLAATPLLLKPNRFQYLRLAPTVGGIWFLSFVGFWVVSVTSARLFPDTGLWSIESIVGLFNYMVLPHIAIPLPMVAGLVIMRRKAEHAPAADAASPGAPTSPPSTQRR